MRVMISHRVRPSKPHGCDPQATANRVGPDGRGVATRRPDSNTDARGSKLDLSHSRSPEPRTRRRVGDPVSPRHVGQYQHLGRPRCRCVRGPPPAYESQPRIVNGENGVMWTRRRACRDCPLGQVTRRPVGVTARRDPEGHTVGSGQDRARLKRSPISYCFTVRIGRHAIAFAGSSCGPALSEVGAAPSTVASR